MYSLIGSYITMRHTTWNTFRDLCAISYGGIYPRRIRVCIYIYTFSPAAACLLAPSPKMEENTSNLYYHPIFPITHTAHHRFTKNVKKKKDRGCSFYWKNEKKVSYSFGHRCIYFFSHFSSEKGWLRQIYFSQQLYSLPSVCLLSF